MKRKIMVILPYHRLVAEIAPRPTTDIIDVTFDDKDVSYDHAEALCNYLMTEGWGDLAAGRFEPDAQVTELLKEISL